MRHLLPLLIAGAAGAAEPIDLAIDPARVAATGFLGFGAEWDPGFWSERHVALGAGEAQWSVVVDRLRWMRPGLVRMMVQARWYTAGDGRCDWTTPEMRALDRQLAVCDELGIDVALTDWGVATWAKVAGFAGNGDAAYADAVVACLDHLVRARGHTRIRWFVLVNEPNFEGGGFDAWAAGVRAVSARLRAAHLPVALLGPDTSGDRAWHQRAARELADAFDAWDVHRYIPDGEVGAGALEPYLREHWDDVRAGDPRASAKPLIVAEAGMADGMSADKSPRIEEQAYGAFMVDYAIQATRAGSHAVLAWMLDDSSHAGFTWGMWTDAAGGQRLKRWAHAWMPLCRCVRPGATVLRIDAPEGVRALAARHPDGTWTLVAVNRRPDPITVRWRGDVPATPIRRWLSAPGDLAVDAAGMPAASAAGPVDFAAGVVVDLPAESVVVLTSVE